MMKCNFIARAIFGIDDYMNFHTGIDDHINGLIGRTIVRPFDVSHHYSTPFGRLFAILVNDDL